MSVTGAPGEAPALLRRRGRTMATDNKKIKDPTDTALSAIEQALNLGQVPDLDALAEANRPTDAPAAAKADTTASDAPPRLPDVEDHDFTSGPLGSLDPEAVPPPPLESADRPADLDEGRTHHPAFVAPDRAAV